jgi:transposase
MEKITTIGLDLAKNVFHVVCCDERGKIVKKRKLRRSQVLSYFVQMPVCRVGMEACGGAHYWAREIERLGHEVKLIAAQHVKPYVRGNKNDYNDALAIAEAVSRAEMRFVSVKSLEQQDIQAMVRLRERRVAERTALCNQLRGLLGEYGLVLPKGITTVRRCVPEILDDGTNGLSPLLRRLLARSYRQLQSLDADIDFYTEEMMRHAREDDACQRLQTIPSFGAVVATVFYSVVGDGRAFRRGRDVSASLGLVPRQHSSGGKEVLLGISKRGDRYLRSLLVHGARSVVIHAAHKNDPLSRWINHLVATRGFNKAVVALANKMARTGWAILAHNTVYRPA